jgi:glycosyltransferase involved in cell wall biosynthesis
MYFHGHSTGGTNPSLLEAMASRALIAAHGNEFNRQILTADAFYFNDSHDIKELIDNDCAAQLKKSMVENNLKKIESHYRWESIIDEYEKFILECYQNKNAVERDIYHRRESYQ